MERKPARGGGGGGCSNPFKGQNLRVNRVTVIYRCLFSATKPLKGLKPGKNEPSFHPSADTATPFSLSAVSLASIYAIRG